MDEDEEFYDSLDEEHLPDVNSQQNVIPNIPDIPEPKVQIKSTKIPLYVGETDKEDLKIFKKSLQALPPVKKTSNSCLSCEMVNKVKKIENVVKKKTENSYWELYCQKNRILGDENNEMLRSFYGSTKTFSSLLNSSSCLTGSTWDAPSVFEKYMPKKYGSHRSDLPSYDEEDIETSTITTRTFPEVDLDNLKSVSQHNLQKKTSKTSKLSKSKSNTSNCSFRPLSLKCVGPDTEKLDLLRKQQEYGTRASSRNRARIILNLTKLKKELHVDKKVVTQ